MKLVIALLASSVVYAGEFDGTWQTNCFSINHTNYRETVTISGDQAQVQQTQYKDNQCITATGTGQANGAIVIEEMDAHKNFDLTYDAFTITLKDKATVKMANFMEYCGISNWELNVPQNVMGKTCGENLTFPNKGDKHYNIVGLNEKGDLLLGQMTPELTGTTPQTRPVELAVDYPYIKQ